MQGVNFDFVSAIELGNGWYLTAAHAVVGSWGTAKLTQVGTGPNPVTYPGQASLVTEQYVHELFVPSHISGGNYSIDVCIFKASATLGGYHAVFGGATADSCLLSC